MRMQTNILCVVMVICNHDVCVARQVWLSKLRQKGATEAQNVYFPWYFSMEFFKCFLWKLPSFVHFNPRFGLWPNLQAYLDYRSAPLILRLLNLARSQNNYIN